MLQTKSNSILTPYSAVIDSVTAIDAHNRLFEVRSDCFDAGSCKPGQFVQLWIPGAGEVPISVSAIRSANTIELLVRKAGRVTSALFNLAQGDRVGLRGPYGHSFPVDQARGASICLVAGGLGIAPIRSVWKYVLKKRQLFKDVTLFYGIRHERDLLFGEEIFQLFNGADVQVNLVIEDISHATLPPHMVQQGLITDCIKRSTVGADDFVFICGPPVMYRYVLEELQAKEIPCHRIWFSLERHMKCGIGRCGHCFIGGKAACTAGPVFCYDELKNAFEVVELV